MKLNSTLLKIFAVIALLALPTVAWAQIQSSNNPSIYAVRGLSLNIVGCGASSGALCIIGNILSFILAISFIIAVVFLVVGGFRYVTSGGNEESVEKAKGTITNAVIGIVVIILAFVIMQLVLNLVGTGNAGNVTT